MKTINAKEVLAHPTENSILVNCHVETFDSATGQLFSSDKQIKISLECEDIHCSNIDVSRLAQTVTKKCKYIPKKLMTKVENAIYELHLRNTSNFIGDFNNRADEEDIAYRIDECLECMYGSIEEKIAITSEILFLCKRVQNLRIVLQNDTLLSALSRILSDDLTQSTALIFNVGKIFLIIAYFEELHPYLSSYRVGSLIMSAMELEAQRIQQWEKDNLEENLDGRHTISYNSQRQRHDNVMYICLTILNCLADNVTVFHKMMKKGIVPLLFKILQRKCMNCVHGIFVLMKRASIFEENVHNIVTLENSIAKLVSFLSRTNDGVIDDVLPVLFNLSFDSRCLQQMLHGDIISFLPSLLRVSSSRPFALRILYHLSACNTSRMQLQSEELTSLVTHLLFNNPHKCISAELGAVVVNLSLIPFHAEQMILSVGGMISQAIKNKDILLLKTIRNLSIWTHCLQIGIEDAIESEDFDSLLELTKNPSRFFSHLPQSDQESTGDMPRPISNYSACKFWNDHIESIAIACFNQENDDVVLELIGTLNHMTSDDMAASKNWASFMTEMNILDFILRILKQEQREIDMVLEVIILCSQMCDSVESAALLNDSTTIREILEIRTICEQDSEILLQLLDACHKLLSFEETRHNLLMKTDAFDFLIEALECENEVLRFSSTCCLDLIITLERETKHEILETFAKVAKEKRFCLHNKVWLCHTQSTFQ